MKKSERLPLSQTEEFKAYARKTFMEKRMKNSSAEEDNWEVRLRGPHRLVEDD